jgi:hypothetical protein
MKITLPTPRILQRQNFTMGASMARGRALNAKLNIAISLAFCLTGTGLVGSLLPATSALAQSINSEDSVVQDLLRRLPDRAKTGALGILKVSIFPEASLNGQAVTLAPGTRIFSMNNMIILPGTIQDEAIAVLYRKDMLGQVIEAWIVNREEIAAVKKLQGLR